MADPTLSVLDGSTFVVSDRRGDLRSDTEREDGASVVLEYEHGAFRRSVTITGDQPGEIRSVTTPEPSGRTRTR
jgi:hypothetical protein